MGKVGDGYIVYGDEVETLAYDWGDIKILSSPKVTGAERFTFGMVVTKPGKGHDFHNHPDADEIIFVLSGEAEHIFEGEKPVRVRLGASIYIPQGVVHSTINVGWEPLRLLIVYAPTGAEEVLRGLPDCTVVPPQKST